MGGNKSRVTTEITQNNATAASPASSKTANQAKLTVNARQKIKRKAEDKMAMIFIAIVTGWLVTNFPRILLNFQEVIFVNKIQRCILGYPDNPDP